MCFLVADVALQVVQVLAGLGGLAAAYVALRRLT